MALVALCGCSRGPSPDPAREAVRPAPRVPPAELSFIPPDEASQAEWRAPVGAMVSDDTPERPGDQGRRPEEVQARRQVRPDDPDEVIRRWLLGDLRPAEAPERFSGTETDPTLQAGNRDPWLEYLSLPEGMAPGDREQALRDLLDEPISGQLRTLILLDISSDLSFQSRRAAFIRRYGFYANWFNRVTYATSRAVQGNLQGVGQAVVDTVFEGFGVRQVTPAERRIYKLLRDLEREGRGTRKDQKRMASLESKIGKAMAEADLERAEFALEQGNPDLARFYARGAQVRLPGDSRARKLENQAEADIAARRRRFLASNQVGFPDRVPPFQADPPELLRASLSRRHSDLIAQLSQHDAAVEARRGRKRDEPPAGPEPLDPGQEILARLLASLPDQNQAATVAMRQWADTLQEAGYAPREQTLWLQRLLQDPQHNPDLRLARAQGSRRGDIATFIFVGPESSREQAYTFASRMTTAFDALAGVGFFYVFEVFYRAGLAVFSPPPPHEEMLDAASIYIAAAPADPSSRRVAGWLIDQYLEAGRFDRARDILERYGELDPARNTELLELEARRYYRRAAAFPEGSVEKVYFLARTVETAPTSKVAAQAKKKLAEKAQPREEAWEFEASWASIAEWFPEPLPGPFPGKPQWFDGNPATGEIVGGTLRFEGEGADPANVLMTYAVHESGRTNYIQEWLLLEAYAPRVREWIRYQLAEANRSERQRERLGRPRIPYSVMGGVGLSGVDFYPQLREIELQPGELDLYKSPM
jgi:hypothetical protein